MDFFMRHESEAGNRPLQRLLHQGMREVLREDFHAFVEKCFATLHPATDFLPNWHVTLIGEYLEACRRREIRKLIINMPPRMLKSMTVSVAWPAYLLGHDPSERIMAASYAAGLSVKNGLDCRNIIQSEWYRQVFPDMRIARDQNEKHKFATTQHGHRIATSVGGTATGEGGNFLIMDDPHTPAQALSLSQRETAVQWFDHTFATRLDDKQRGVMVVVMQRLHADDLSGHLLAKGGWEMLRLPAIAEEETTHCMGSMRYVRKAGGLLHPEREGAAQLDAMRQELGSYAFAAQYQQNPLPADAGMVRREWFGRFRDAPPVFERVVQSWDTAIKAGQGHDFSVCMTFGEHEGKSYLLDVLAVKQEYPELKRSVMRLAQLWQPHAVLVEDKASGQSLLQDLRRERDMPPLIARMPVTDKVTRFAACTALIEAGKLMLPREAAWLATFERELLTFPNAAHDDHVDALSQYLAWLRERQGSGMRIRSV
jgi:predicted phage terminase large subunit-like protein